MALISDWMSRCLLCMTDVPAKIPVFGSHGQRKSVRRMIAEFLNVTVRESDNYPRQICEKCYDTLQKINDLKVSAHESLRNLKLLQNFHQQKEQEERKTEYIRLWLGSQRTEQGETSIFDQQDSSNQQQSDFTCSSISANEATSSVAFNISLLVSENSDTVNNTASASSKTARQEKSERGVHQKGRKRADTPLPFSTPSSRSCSPQPGALPPESSRKQYRSAARSQSKNRSKIAVQQNGVDELPEKDVDHSGSPKPGSLPPETTGKGSATRKRSKNLPVNCESTPLQSKGNNLVTEPQESLVFHRSRSCSPVRGNNCNVSSAAIKKRPRGRPRSRSVPPAKRSKTDPAEPRTKLPNKTVSIARKPAPWKLYVDDDIRFERVTTSCDLKQLKKRIPYVKLERLDLLERESKCTVPQLPLSLVQKLQEFRLVEEIRDKKLGIMQQFCWVCSKKFTSGKNMEKHLMKHRGKSQEGSSSSKLVAEPGSKCAMPTLFSCNLCRIQFTTNGSRQRHMKFHSEKKWSHKCEECEETFRTNVTLERHMTNHNISCQVCDAVFMTTEDLENHRKSHEQQLGYTCSCCLQQFSKEEALRKHMVQHRKCTLCNKTFAGKNELAAHVGECHKVCNICDETVADEEELESHIDTSHEKCNLCGEQFLGEEELGTHLSKHPYQCVLCLSAFNDKAQRNEHLKLSHQDMLELLMENMAKEKTTA